MTDSSTNKVYEGRVNRARFLGNLYFVDVLYNGGLIQGILKRELLGERFPKKKAIHIGDIISMKGIESSSEKREVSIDVTEYSILPKSNSDNLIDQNGGILKKKPKKNQGKKIEYKVQNFLENIDIVLLKETSLKRGFHESEFNQYLGILNVIQQNSVEVDNYNELTKSLMDSFKDKSVHFVYYLCLRWNNDQGGINISDSLKPFKFVGVSGKIEKRSGESKLFHLEKALDFSRQLKKYGLNDHTLLISNFDLYKYSNLKSSLEYKVDKYIKECADFLGKEINVLKQTDFFDGLGGLKSEYDAIFDSVYNNDGKFIDRSYVSEEIVKNDSKKKILLKDWNDKLCKFFTSSGIARNIFEGITLKKQNNLFLPIVFNKNASASKEFNSALNNKLPFICLPIYYDNSGGIRYA